MRKLEFEKKRSKKGLSVMLGYVLLVSFGIIMSVIVYSYLKTYVPREVTSCPDAVSLFIKSAQCTDDGELNLTIRNNGKFNVAGYYAFASEEDPNAVATTSIASQVMEEVGGPIFVPSYVNFGIPVSQELETNNTLFPSEEANHLFRLSQQIERIEIIPVRYVKEGTRERLASCTNGKVFEIVNCGPYNPA
ncbi:MAG: hypothetical protein KC516_00950 [Nanoarchaeota archaeon]|nr:hypothetical protein [Nanoarchaeota archaeon]